MNLFLLVASLLLAASPLVNAQEGLLEQCKDSFGTRHKLNDSYVGPDGCNTCRCLSVGNVCTRKLCDPKPKMTAEANKCVDSRGNLHKVDESYTHVDGCNTCVCKSFGGLCTRKFCFKTEKVTSVCVDSQGQGHQEGEEWMAEDGCNKCECGALGPVCTQSKCIAHDSKMGDAKDNEPQIVDETGDSPCVVNGETKWPGATWLTGDSCNICTCTGLNGKVECTDESCRARFMRLVDPQQFEDGNGAKLNSAAVSLIISSVLVMLYQ